MVLTGEFTKRKPQIHLRDELISAIGSSSKIPPHEEATQCSRNIISLFPDKAYTAIHLDYSENDSTVETLQDIDEKLMSSTIFPVVVKISMDTSKFVHW